jgi:hypothetical protein
MRQPTRKKNGARSARQIFVLPAAVAAISFAGLITALVGDGPFDAASWLALGAPVALIVWFAYRR